MAARLGPVRHFLDAYSICLGERERIFNLLQREEADGYPYGARATRLRAPLAAGELWGRLLGPQPVLSPDERLREAMALVTVLSEYIAKELASDLVSFSSAFVSSDGSQYWIAIRPPTSLGASLSEGIRNLDRLHFTLAALHDPLLVTPARHESVKLVRVPRRGGLELRSERRLSNRSFHLAVSSMSGEAELIGESRTSQPPLPPHAFHLTAVEPLARQIELLESVLGRANEMGAAVLVLPELRVSPPLLAAARQFLRTQPLGTDRGLLFVAAGSWHVIEDGSWRNRCEVLDYRGETLWRHDKLREYVVVPKNVADAPHVFARIGVGPKGGYEDILRGDSLEFYDSAAGRLAVAICLGFFSPEVASLLLASGANLFLVPAMTDSTQDMEVLSKALVRSQHAFTLAANCGAVGRKAPSFVRWPGKGANLGKLEPPEILFTLDLNVI